jgi:hypothetical protein
VNWVVTHPKLTRRAAKQPSDSPYSARLVGELGLQPLRVVTGGIDNHLWLRYESIADGCLVGWLGSARDPYRLVPLADRACQSSRDWSRLSGPELPRGTLCGSEGRLQWLGGWLRS